MCGIHGIISGPKGERNADDFLKSSFVANQLRGFDASGLVVINHAKETYDYSKLPVCGQFFIQTKAANALVREACLHDRVAIGHVRASTTGGNGVDSAHPFECWDSDEKNVLVGVHNGTLTGWSHKKDAKYYSVDSEWALNHIRSEGFDAFEDFTGSYCFVWWDDRTPDMLNIALNKERPMNVVMLKEGGMAFASEAGMLYWLLERHDVHMDGEVLELQPDQWYRFPVKNPKGYTKRELPKSRYSSGYSQTASTYKTAVDKVKELLTKFKAASPAGTVPEDIGKSEFVSQTEHDAAAAMKLLGKKVKFVPMYTHKDNVEGIVELDAGEFSGICAKSYTIASAGEEWETTVIGVDDIDVNNITVIVKDPQITRSGTTATTVH